MTSSWTPLSFRAKLTLWWSVTFGLLLAVANVAIYTAFDLYLARDLDRKVRTVAATELASSTDGPGIHLHDFTREALSGGEFADKFVQIFDADGRVRLASQTIRQSPPLVGRDLIGSALEGRAPLVNLDVAGRAGRAAVLRTEVRGERYAILVGLFRDDIDAHLIRLAWLLGFVWIGGLAATAALGYWLASRALLPVVGISRRAARIAQGDFAARLDPPAQLDELGEMTALLNTMLNRLHGALEAHRRFAADASHELRAPITAMTGEIDVALMRPRTGAEYRETLVVVGERMSALSSLCEDLMLLAHAQEGAQAIDLREVPLLPQLHQSAARLVDAASSREICIEARDLPDLVVHANPRLLARVLDNVLVNAVSYNRRGGLVSVSGAVNVAHSEEWTPEMVVITVKDTGPGIPADQFERVFDRFYRLDPSRTPGAGGSGLGLTICREVLAVLRGSIRIADSSDAGTTVVIELPGRLASDRRVSEPLGSPIEMVRNRLTIPAPTTREVEREPIA